MSSNDDPPHKSSKGKEVEGGSRSKSAGQRLKESASSLAHSVLSAPTINDTPHSSSTSKETPPISRFFGDGGGTSISSSESADAHYSPSTLQPTPPTFRTLPPKTWTEPKVDNDSPFSDYQPSSPSTHLQSKHENRYINETDGEAVRALLAAPAASTEIFGPDRPGETHSDRHRAYPSQELNTSREQDYIDDPVSYLQTTRTYPEDVWAGSESQRPPPDSDNMESVWQRTRKPRM